MEKRYQALMEKYEKSVASKDGLERENSQLHSAVTEARQTNHHLQSSVMKVESEKEQLKLEIDSMERDKASLQSVYEQSKKEISELHTKIEALSSKVLTLTAENGELDAKLQHALSEKSRAFLNHSKIEQEKAILEKSNAWLNEELERKTLTSNEERQKATQRIIELQNQYYEAIGKLESLENDHARLKEQLNEYQESLKVSTKQLKETKESLAEKQESFEQELSLAQRMAQLYRESSDEHSKRSMELEGIVNELRIHMEESAAVHMDTVAKLEEECRKALQKAEEEKEIRERVVAAAATASFDLSTPARNEDPSQNKGHGTSAEIYAKLIEAEEKLRLEKLKNREKEIYFEDLLIEVEKRADLLQEQQTEFDNIRSSHTKLLGDIEQLASEKRKLHSSLKDAESKSKSLEQERKSLEQQVKDLGQQVARLLHDAVNQRKEDTQIASFIGGDASDVTTQYLVEFSTIEELQQQNEKLLKVNRELAVAAEATKEEAQEEMRQEYEDKIEKLRNDLEDLRRNRQHVEEIFEQVVRQRDTLRNLLQSAGGDLVVGREMYSLSMGKETELNKSKTTQSHSIALDSEGLAYREMYEDLEKKFEDYKKKANDEYANIEKELSSAKKELISMKKEVAQAQAQSEFETERSKRLSSSIDSQQKHVESLLASNAKYQAILNESERRLSISQQSLDDCEQKMRTLDNRVHSLESEKKILVEAEQRLTTEASALSQEKFRIAAELDVLRKQFNDLESNSTKELSKYQALSTKSMEELSDAQRELSTAKSRVEYAHKEVTNLKNELKSVTKKLEDKLEATQADLSEMQRRASAAEAKADLLQEAVRKSEEKVARLEIEKHARVTAPTGDAQNNMDPENVQGAEIDVKIKEMHTEIKVLREELVSAQEALALSTGHAKQFETIAHTAEEALKSSQADYEKFKRDASNRVASIESEVNRLRMEISKKDMTIKELKQEQIKLRQEAENLKHLVELEKTNSKQEMQQTTLNLEKEREKVTALIKDSESLRKEVEEVKKAYDTEVVAHGDALRRVDAAESSYDALQSRLNAISTDLEKERSSRKQTETEYKAKIEEQVAQLEDLKKKAEHLSKHRDTLQQELEAIASTNDPNANALSNSMKMLRQEREAAELNLSLCEREVNRLRQENAIAKRAAEESRAQLAAEIERQAKKKSEEQTNQIDYLEQLSITRESNATLRSEKAEQQKHIKSLEIQLRETESKLDPLELQLKQKEGEILSVKEELKVALESALRWEQRSKAFSEKANEVDMAEHEQLKSDLCKAKEELATQKEELDALQKKKEEVEGRLKHSETVAQKANAKSNTLYKQIEEHKKKLDSMSKSSSEQVKKQHEEKEKRITELTLEKTALEEKIAELAKKEESWRQKAKNLLKNCEKSNLAKKQADGVVKSLKSKISELENEISVLKTNIQTARVEEKITEAEDVPETSGKRKLDPETGEEKSLKKLRPSASVFTPTKVHSPKATEPVAEPVPFVQTELAEPQAGEVLQEDEPEKEAEAADTAPVAENVVETGNTVTAEPEEEVQELNPADTATGSKEMIQNEEAPIYIEEDAPEEVTRVDEPAELLPEVDLQEVEVVPEIEKESEPPVDEAPDNTDLRMQVDDQNEEYAPAGDADVNDAGAQAAEETKADDTKSDSQKKKPRRKIEWKDTSKQ